MRLLSLGLMALAIASGLPGSASHAQLTPNTSANEELTHEAHRLANKLVEKFGVQEMIDPLLASQRESTIALLQQGHMSEVQAIEIWDTALQPEFRARFPELLNRFADIIAADFTVPELEAVLDNEINAVRRSAATKVPLMQRQFVEAGTEWGRQVGLEAMEKNRATMGTPRLPVTNGAEK